MLLCSTGSQLSMSWYLRKAPLHTNHPDGDEECPEQLFPDKYFLPVLPLRGLEMSLGSITATAKAKSISDLSVLYLNCIFCSKGSAVTLMSLIPRSCMVGVQSTALTGAS